MSLKAFHLIFVTAASALGFGCGVWWMKDYCSAEGRLGDLLLSLGAFVVGAGLLVYERYFLKKTKDVGYL